MQNNINNYHYPSNKIVKQLFFDYNTKLQSFTIVAPWKKNVLVVECYAWLGQVKLCVFNFLF